LGGAPAPALDLPPRVEGILREEFVGEDRRWALMAACEVCVSLRSPNMGETSGSVIRGLSLGKPLVVSDVGWFAELPDEVAVKVAVDGRAEVDELAAVLERLASDDGLRARMGAAALAEARDRHDLDRVASRYAEALEEAAGRPTVARKVIEAVAAAAADVR